MSTIKCLLRNISEKLYKGLIDPHLRPWLNEPIYKFLGNLFFNERIVEIPFVFQNLGLKKGAKILDFGCKESRVSIELASLGYRVTGVDLNGYQFARAHPNFRFIKGDFLNNDFPNDSFDGVIAISSIEHAGLSAYGEEDRLGDDRAVVNEIYRILKPEGRFIVTLPSGKKRKTLRYRIYDEKALKLLLKRFKIIKEEYFIGKGRKYWISATKKEIFKADSRGKILGFVEIGVQGVACLVCKK